MLLHNISYCVLCLKTQKRIQNPFKNGFGKFQKKKKDFSPPPTLLACSVLLFSTAQLKLLLFSFSLTFGYWPVALARPALAAQQHRCRSHMPTEGSRWQTRGDE
jgi:hypothetical protein